MKSFAKSTPVHSTWTNSPEQSGHVVTQPAFSAKPLQEEKITSKRVNETHNHELFARPSAWLWRGNLVIFAPNPNDIVKVEERPAQYDHQGVLTSKGVYVIEAQYTIDAALAHVSWELDCDLVTTRSIYFYGTKEIGNFWFVPGYDNPSRVYANRGLPVDGSSALPKIDMHQDGAMASDVEKVLDQPVDMIDRLAFTGTSRDVLFYMQTMDVAESLKSFEHLALDANRLPSQPVTLEKELKTKVNTPAAGATTKNVRRVDKKEHAPKSHLYC